MEIKGKGSVLLDCALRDGSVSSVRLNDILFVLKLDRPLISWSKLSKLGYTLSG